MFEEGMFNQDRFRFSNEKSTAQVLPYLSESYLMDVVEQTIMRRSNMYQVSISNLVYLINQNIEMSRPHTDPVDIPQLEDMQRNLTWSIINKICDLCYIDYNKDEDFELYSFSYWLYDFTISNFKYYLIRFCCEFIHNNKKELIRQLKLTTLKASDKSSTYNYSSKIYDDKDMVLITSNLYAIIQYMCSLEIELSMILNYIYEPQIANMLDLMIEPKDDYFKTNFMSALNGPDGNNLVNEINMELNKIHIKDGLNIATLIE